MKRYFAILFLVLILIFTSCSNTTEQHPDQSKKDTSDKVSNEVTSDPATEAASETEAITSPANTETNELLSRERAIEIALQAAVLTRDEVFDIDAELERERGDIIWEVDFETRDYEFSYHVDAETGAVTRSDKEIND